MSFYPETRRKHTWASSREHVGLSFRPTAPPTPCSQKHPHPVLNAISPDHRGPKQPSCALVVPSDIPVPSQSLGPETWLSCEAGHGGKVSGESIVLRLGRSTRGRLVESKAGPVSPSQEGSALPPMPLPRHYPDAG